MRHIWELLGASSQIGSRTSSVCETVMRTIHGIFVLLTHKGLKASTSSMHAEFCVHLICRQRSFSCYLKKIRSVEVPIVIIFKLLESHFSELSTDSTWSVACTLLASQRFPNRKDIWLETGTIGSGCTLLKQFQLHWFVRLCGTYWDFLFHTF